MGTDPYQHEQLLTLLRSFNVKTYEAGPDGFVHIELFPVTPEPANGQVPLAQKGKVDGAAETPYHKLFGGNMPRFNKSEA